MAVVTEIAPEIYRISLYVPEIDLQFNHFLVRDEEPLLFTTGLKATFPVVREAVAGLIDPERLRWIGFSHFESDECGALNYWLDVAPTAEPVCSVVGAMVSVNDFAVRPARGLQDGETLPTGRLRFRFCATAHFPHGWDAGLLFEETQRTLLCSDLFHHFGNPEALTEADVVERTRHAVVRMQAGPLADYVPYTPHTGRILCGLAHLQPKTLAVMHGSSFTGDGARALCDLDGVLRATFGDDRLSPSTSSTERSI